MRRIKSSAVVVLFLYLTLQIGVVRAEGTIYIREDGSVEGTDKIYGNGSLYTLTGNIYDSQVSVLRDDVVIDGAGYVLRGAPSGIVLLYRDNVTITNFVVSTNFTSDNIYVYYCSNCTIENNTITPFIELFSGTGIDIWGGGSHIISGNQLMNNLCGIHLGGGTSNNSIFNNNITNNTRGVQISYSQNNSIYNNTFNNKFDIFGTSQNNNIYENQIIPEFPSWIILPLISTLTLATIYFRSLIRRRERK